MTSYTPNYLQRPTSPNTISLQGAGALTYGFGGEVTNIQSIAMNVPVPAPSDCGLSLFSRSSPLHRPQPNWTHPSFKA